MPARAAAAASGVSGVASGWAAGGRRGGEWTQPQPDRGRNGGPTASNGAAAFTFPDTTLSIAEAVSAKGENCRLLSPPARENPAGEVRHLYVHVPFCPKICPYCSFYKEASDRNKTQRFLDAVLLELDQQSAVLPPLRPRTIFFGGGTPSALSTPQLEYLLTGLRERLDLSALTEWTLEMNPATVSLEKAQLLRGLGVNRVSMGVQSWEPQLLAVLGRVHSAEQARRSYDILREAGFTNVNLDLIFGIPTQTPEMWRRSLEATIALNRNTSARTTSPTRRTRIFSGASSRAN